MLMLPVSAGAATLDTLLKGFDDGCDYTVALDTLLRSSYDFARGQGSLKIPPAYALLFHAPVVETEGNYLHTVIPVSGTWRGVPVKALDIYITHDESGFVVHSVIFEESATEQAKKTFAARAKRSNEKLNAGDGAEMNTEFGVFKGKPTLMCDLST
ncbi:hypothetical protein [Pararhizobium sp.]|uniref:hypothetical protein n=1 Tax=Pararhizobium sp. TaxID=1977563 RepID=UPI002724E170|nr:hypothetical protein [Pararhizobium sp.]MDO9415605.1 hypothetical protein [Pararhizobium sp.]